MLIGVLIGVAAIAPLAAQGFEARAGHFRVATTTSPIIASAAAARLERVRAHLTALGFTLPPARTEAVVFADLAQMQPYSPNAGSAGFFQQGTETSFIAVTWDSAGDPYRHLAHEMAHQAMTSLAGKHPPWLREGLAELLSNLEPVEGGLKLGSPIAAHLDAAHHGPPRSRVYAQNWMRAHRAVVGRPFAGTLAQRLAALEAPDPADIPLPENWPTEILPVAIDSGATPEASVRPLAPWEWEHRLAEMLRAMNRAAQARETLAALRSRFPERPEPAESLGALDMDAYQYDQAEERLAEAVRLGSTNPWTHYRYSLLLMRPGKAAALAARHARRAVELDAAQPLYWLARAHAEMQLSQWEAAGASLGELRRRAADPLLAEQVRVELAEIGRRREQASRPPPEPKPPERPPIIVAEAPPDPPSISPPPPARPRQPAASFPGTLTFWGYLRRVDCGEGEKILTVSNRIFSIRVRERSGSPARLYSPPGKWRQIPCTLRGVEVNAIYRPSAHFGGINGDLVALIF